jgi:hypothetical protein
LPLIVNMTAVMRTSRFRFPVDFCSIGGHIPLWNYFNKADADRKCGVWSPRLNSRDEAP